MGDDPIAVETARTLYLVYGDDAVEMSELRCKELAAAGDTQGVRSWTQVLEEVKKLVTGGGPGQSGPKN